MAPFEAILYVDIDNPCEELTKKLQEYNIVFKEWKVDQKSVDFQLPLLIAGNGVYTEKQIISYDKYLPKLLIGQQ